MSLSCEIKVKVVPNASRSEVVGMLGDAVKIKIRAVPEDGKANKALLEFLAEKLSLPKKSVELITGDTSREKRVRIAGIAETETRRMLGI